MDNFHLIFFTRNSSQNTAHARLIMHHYKINLP